MCVHQYDDIFFCIISFLKCRSCIYTIIILCVYMNLRSIQSSWAGQKSTPHNRSTHSISSIQSYIQQQDSTFCVNKFQVSKYTCSFSQASFLVYYLIFHSNCQLKPSPNVHLFLVVHMKYIFLKLDQMYKSCTNYKICEFCTQVHIIYVLVFDVVRVEVFNHDKDLINQSHHSSLKAFVKQCNFSHYASDRKKKIRGNMLPAKCSPSKCSLSNAPHQMLPIQMLPKTKCSPAQMLSNQMLPMTKCSPAQMLPGPNAPQFKCSPVQMLSMTKCSLVQMLPGPNAPWSKCSPVQMLPGPNALWSKCSPVQMLSVQWI